MMTEDILATLARFTPALYIPGALIYTFLIPNITSFYILLAIIACYPFNWILKNIVFRSIYTVLCPILCHLVSEKYENELPLLGIGQRPDNAHSCGLYLDNTPGDTTYGMPSGHSQLAWTIGTFIICILLGKISRQLETKNIEMETIFWIVYYILVGSIILASMIYISYSRVYIASCHTIQQVIIGGIIGCGTGGILFYYLPE